MKVVLDTNVFVSGVFFGGPPGEILEAWHAGRFRLVVSLEVLAEYERVGAELTTKYPGVDLKPFLELMAIDAELCDPPPLPAPASADPDDDKFLACAVASGAACIVSGDKHLLQIAGTHNIEIVRPRDFVDRYLTERR